MFLIEGIILIIALVAVLFLSKNYVVKKQLLSIILKLKSLSTKDFKKSE